MTRVPPIDADASTQDGDETGVLVEHPAPGVLQITLDGARRRNALGRSTTVRLERAIRQAYEETVRVVVLTGAGDSFCAGADLRTAAQGGLGVGGRARGLVDAHRWLDDLRRVPKPVVAAVEGGAVGFGWSLALACDLTVAGQEAYFLSPFVERGLVPDGGCAWFLAQAVGTRRAAELLLLSERVSAARAEQLGLVNRVVATGDALREALALAVRLTQGSPDALMLTKRLLTTAGDHPTYRTFLEHEWPHAALAMNGPDWEEGRAAFLERRAPDFTRGL